MIKKQFTLYLENKPGELAAVTRRMAAAKVNIEGISVSAGTDVALVQLVPSDTVRTRKLLERFKVPFSTQDVSIMMLKHQPGALSSIVSKLADLAVNINYVYATGCSCNGTAGGCFVVIGADDLKSVEKAWKHIRKTKR
jgi:hypothetical protein